MKLLNGLFAVFTLILVSSVASATVWRTTSIDSDFIQIGPYNTNGGDLVMFDDSDFGGTALVIGSAGGNVSFRDNKDGTWEAILTYPDGGLPVSSLTLTGNYNFTLGMTWDGGATYYIDTSFDLINDPDNYEIVFTDGEIIGRTLAIDIDPIPIPAAIWLFGSGLLGLIGVARRKRNA